MFVIYELMPFSFVTLKTSDNIIVFKLTIHEIILSTFKMQYYHYIMIYVYGNNVTILRTDLSFSETSFIDLGKYINSDIGNLNEITRC